MLNTFDMAYALFIRKHGTTISSVYCKSNLTHVLTIIVQLLLAIPQRWLPLDTDIYLKKNDFKIRLVPIGV